MPVFESADAESVTAHHPDWDADEHVVLRRLTYAIERRAQGKAVQLPPDMSPSQLRAMDEAEVERLLAEHTDMAAVDLSLLEQAIVSWTLRRRPTAQQASAGERGDLMPLSPGAIAALPPAAGQFLREELAKLRDVAPTEAQVGPHGDDFRNAVQDAGDGRLLGPGGPAGIPDAHGSRSHRVDGLGARGAGSRAARPARALPHVVEREVGADT